MERELAAKVVRIQLDEALKPIEVEARYQQVLLVVGVGEQMVGQVWVGARRVLSPALQWQAISQRLAPLIWRAKMRAALAGAGLPEEGIEEAGPAEPAIAVIVCTRDRSEQLRFCLEAIAGLRTRPREVIVVDNCPSDERTRLLCEGLPVRYVREPAPGQARARNRGLAQSGCELVAFTDDDCIVDPGWLDRLEEDFADPLVMGVTGYIGPLELETAAQLWFEEHGGFERYPERRVLDPNEISPLRATAVAGAGANMIFRRSVFDRLGGFAEDLGPGTPARSGDDKYAFYRLLAAGYRIVHDPSRVVWHRHRSDLPALRRVMNDYGVSEFAYTTRCLLEDREPDALVLWRWWLQHYRDDVKRYVRRSPGWVPLWLTAAEVRGAAMGPRRMLSSRRERRGLAPIELARDGNGTGPAPMRQAGVQVEGEAPRMAVAIASRQRCESLRRVLVALSRQDHPSERFEVVVVLDGSSDDSEEMVRELEVPYRLRAVAHAHRGLAATRNRGAQEASEADVIVFLDDDIDPEPGWLAAHANAHREGSGATVALGYYPPARIPEPSLWAIRVQAWWEDHFRRKGQPGHQWTYVDLVDGNMSMPRSTLLDAEGYDERFRGGRRQDWELGVRLLQRGVRFEYRPEAIGTHRLDPQLASGLDHAREEGRWDILLAGKHPQTKGHLPLARLADAFEQRPRRSRARYHPLIGRLPLRGIGLPLLESLEATGQRGRWLALVDRLLLRSYILGMQDAIPDADRLREFLDPEEIRDATFHLCVDLEDPQPLHVPAGAGAVELTIRSAGLPVATVKGTDLAGQWDPRELVERAVDHASGPAQLRSGIEGLTRRAGR